MFAKAFNRRDQSGFLARSSEWDRHSEWRSLLKDGAVEFRAGRRSEVTVPRLRACPDCGLFQVVSALGPDAVARCLRCNAVLRRTRQDSLGRGLAEHRRPVPVQRRLPDVADDRQHGRDAAQRQPVVRPGRIGAARDQEILPSYTIAAPFLKFASMIYVPEPTTKLGRYEGPRPEGESEVSSRKARKRSSAQKIHGEARLPA